MSTYKDWEAIRRLSKKGDTNSEVILLKNKTTDELIVRKVIYGIDQPIYNAVFTREVRALYKLNKCENIVKVLGYDDSLVVKNTKQKVGVIYLEYVLGTELSKVSLEDLTSKDKFSIIQQLLNAIDASHTNGVIHRDINPNNILIDDNKKLKLIDFGICKIKDMVNKSTVYRLGTNFYSAPEVHLHSENATERSDIYSLGAVIYYLFTGNIPPLAGSFKDVIEKTSGIDIELKAVLTKLVEEEPEKRFENIFEVKNAFKKLFTRFLGFNKTIILTAGFDIINKLKYYKLVPKSASKREIEEKYIETNFLELYAFSKRGDQEEIFIFLGSTFIAECFFDNEQSVFDVVEFKKVTPIEKNILKKKYAKIECCTKIVDKRFAHRELKNNSLEVKNSIIDYCKEYNSSNNVNNEYRNKYGVWRDLLDIIKKDIEDNIIRLPYDSYKVNNGFITFTLKKGIFIDEDNLNKEQIFIFEKKVKRIDKVKPIVVGAYENDTYKNGHVILEIKGKNGIQLPKKGEICLDYRKDKVNVERQLDALNVLEKETYNCSFNLKRIITGIEEPSAKVISKEIVMHNKNLDLPQKQAVRKALDSEPICIIQGPPGTGKTNVIIEIILQIIASNKSNVDVEPKRILLVSQSHPAVDKMLEDLIKASNNKLDLLRVGRDEKLNEDVRKKYSINDIKEKWYEEVRFKCNEYSKVYLDEIGISVEEFNDYYRIIEKSKIENAILTKKDKETITTIEEKTRKNSFNRIRKVLEIQKEWINQIVRCDEAELYIIKSTEIIAGTCIGFVSNKVIRNVEFDYVIVDEAAKATFPELTVSLNKAHHIILVGDHKQLPPVIDTELINSNKEKLDRKKLSQGIFEKLYNMFPDRNKQSLTIQYRMHPVIGSLISRVFYDNEIQNGVVANDRKLNIEEYNEVAIQWISTSKCTADERYETVFNNNGKKSYQNFLEKRIIKEKLIELDKKIDKDIEIGIITGYGSQKYILKTMLEQSSFKHLVIHIDTVDAFQGSQKDIIIYSTVRSNFSRHGNGIGFLRSAARLNVAFSRAKCLLIIVGDMNFLDNYKIRGNKFPEIIKYIRETDGCNIIEYGDTK